VKHVSQRAMIAGAIELKGDDDEPIALVQKAIDDLTKTVDERIKAIEAKGGKVEDDETVKQLKARIDDLEKKANRPGADGDPEKKAQAEAERKAFGTYLRLGNATPADELKTLIVSSDPQGGYLAPNEMSTEMIRDITEISPIRQLASVRSTSAPAVSYPKRTGITNGKWKGELEAQEESEPAFGQVEIPVREINTYVDISNQLLADSGGQAEAEVRMALAEDFGEKEGVAFISGTGVVDPEGILKAAGVGYTATGNAATLGASPADKLVDLFYSLKATYRKRGTWLMNAKTIGEVRKLKDPTSGLYLWQPALAADVPPTILGRPVIEDPEMPDIGNAAEPILFGDIGTAYRIIDRIGLSILVNPYLLATNGITRIHATRRVGGKVVQPAAIKKLRCAVA
jgi:HK97 family phage major capsid protein